MFGSNGLSAADVAAVVRNNDGCCNNGGYGMMNGIGGYGFGEGWWVLSMPSNARSTSPTAAGITIGLLLPIRVRPP